MSSTSIIDFISKPFNKPNRNPNNKSNPFSKIKQLFLRENKPIGLQSRPTLPRSAVAGYQYVAFKLRDIIYRYENGNFSVQSFSHELAHKPLCATYCRGTAKELVKKNFITQEDVYTLYEQIYDFNENHPYTIFEKIPVNDFQTINGTVLFLLVGYNVLPYFLASKNNQQYSQYVNNETPLTLRHLQKKENYIEKVVDFLGLDTDEKVKAFLREGWYLLRHQQGLIYKENHKGKITINILIYFDKVCPNAPKNTKNQIIKFVFSQYYANLKDPNDNSFPKTKEEQELLIKENWDGLSEIEQLYWEEAALGEMATPFFFVKETTWQHLFPNEYKAREPISAKRTFLAYFYENNIGVLTPSVHMNTAVVIELNSGRMQGIFQFLKAAFSNKAEELLQGK